MDSDVILEQPVLPGVLKGIKFSVLTEKEAEKFSVINIEAANDVTDPKLGVPNLSAQCATCGAFDVKSCEGHCGIITLPADLFHPYFVSEVVQILNKVCPGCKTIRKDKGSMAMLKKSTLIDDQSWGCKYCVREATKWYPRMKFKLASKDLFGKNASAITVEVNDRLPQRFLNKNLDEVLPGDYWDFIKENPQQQLQQEETAYRPNKRTLSPFQVYHILKDVDMDFIKKIISKPELAFITSIPVTPNINRVEEMMHVASNGQKLIFDARTKAYRRLVDYNRLVDFKRNPDELGVRVNDCLSVSKLLKEKSSAGDPASSKSGLKWFKDVILGKRTDHAFRMTIVGDPRIKLSEIGIPLDISQKLLVPDILNSLNMEKLKKTSDSWAPEKRELFVRRKGRLVCVRKIEQLEIGDTIYRQLVDGDLVLINRPPSVHQHSLIALSVKILPSNSTASLNPLCCSPLRGDFDGDCIHCYVPQSLESRVELRELVALDQQLINGQNGRSLLSLSHDSLAAAYLVRENDIFLSKPDIQQLEMLSTHSFQPLSPAILRSPILQSPIWTGKQLLSMLLPHDFDFDFPMNGVCISKGEILSSTHESAWLQDVDGNIFSSLVNRYGSKTLDILFSAQAVLLEWISLRGLSVSLRDIYLSPNSNSRRNMIEEVSFGLKEANDAFHIKDFLVDPTMEHDIKYGEDHESGEAFEGDHRGCNFSKRGLSQVSVTAYKEVFRDLQNLIYRYATRDNSMLAMVKSGSKGSVLKLVQQGLCLGLQHSNVPLSFKLPRKLSCTSWNDSNDDTCGSNIPYAVVENSFLSGLDPLECFVHSISNRSTSFGDNADLPGTLTRNLMFYMRDLFVAYDGTVRNAYGNQLVQFSYGHMPSSVVGNAPSGLSGNDCGFDGVASQPVGSLAACSLSEAAYSALDTPVSTVEDSALLKLKKVLKSGTKKATAGQTISLFLSKKLERWNYGFEYGAMEVKNHLERVFLSDVVSNVMIIFSSEPSTRYSPWVVHFHIDEESLKRRGLNVQSIVRTLNQKCRFPEDKKVQFPSLRIISRVCEIDANPFCITVEVEAQKGFDVPIDLVRNLVMPVLLRTVVRGFSEFEKVEILWNDFPRASRSRMSSFGELYLRVSMSTTCKKVDFWGSLQNSCLPLMDVIDWQRSHPDNTNEVFRAYGISATWKYFLQNLKSATSEIGKSILEEHLLLVADRLSASGEFLGLNAKGITWQRDQTSISSPFIRACFTNPIKSFIKAAKEEASDDLVGTLDSLAWGKRAPVGTGGSFDILYTGEGPELDTPVDIFNLSCVSSSSEGDTIDKSSPIVNNVWNKDKWGDKTRYPYATKAHKKFNSIPKSDKGISVGQKIKLGSTLKSGRKLPSENEVLDMCSSLQSILKKYQIDECVSESDKAVLMKALLYHPQGLEKIGAGSISIKVGYHLKHKKSRCFHLVREDGTVEDFSYQKCILGAAKRISPQCLELVKMRFQR